MVDFTFDLNLYQYSLICSFAMVALALNFAYNVAKSKENLKELAVATVLAEGLIVCMFLSLHSLGA